MLTDNEMYNRLILLAVIPLLVMLFVVADYSEHDVFAQYTKSTQDSSEDNDNAISDIQVASDTNEMMSETTDKVEEITSDVTKETQEIVSEAENQVEETVDDIKTTVERPEVNVDVGDNNTGGGCLIATAAYGTELAPQVQYLREIRDNTVLTTSSGAAFMSGFNTIYYSFAPTVADLERENPLFKEAVRVFITPMISTLSIMTLAENGSESEVLGFGMSIIALNLGMYVAVPAAVGFAAHKYIKSRR